MKQGIICFLVARGGIEPGQRMPILVGDTVNLDQTTFGVKDADLYSDLLKYQTKRHTNRRYCAGHYHAMTADTLDAKDMLRHMQVNYEGAVYVLKHIVPWMRQQGSGHISLVGSVAGYRGLPQSLAYGPTKAALINLAETLYLDLHPHGIGISLINPGFVDTPLTAGNTFTMPALLTPAQAAQAILRGWAQGRFEIHFPKRFTFWMKALRLFPNRLYFFLVRQATH
jgi:short-subunit dehydrogenase